MGAVKHFLYPKYVWSPTGGWWCNPRNWKRNTAFAFFASFLLCVPVVYASTQLERRPIPPYRPTLSQRWAKHAKEEDPRL